jgi:hypothetical protein
MTWAPGVCQGSYHNVQVAGIHGPGREHPELLLLPATIASDGVAQCRGRSPTHSLQGWPHSWQPIPLHEGLRLLHAIISTALPPPQYPT